MKRGDIAEAEVRKIMACPPAKAYYMMLFSKLKAFVTACAAVYSGMVDPGEALFHLCFDHFIESFSFF